ncbi:MAG: hypothetical protein ACRBBR_11380 [Cellvibrionaceae bacterium]
MKYILMAILATMMTSTVWGQGLPDDLHAMPIAESLPGHEWSYRQGLDFDVIHFQNAEGNGLRFYMDVSSNDVQSSDYIEATIMGQKVKLFKKCESKKNCMYTTTINSGIQQNGRDLLTQIWVKPENNDIEAYVNWLSSLKFVLGENKS